MHGRPSRIRERFEAASCSAGRRGVRDVDDRSGRADQTDGQKTEDLSDFAGLLRSGDRRAIDEGGSGGVGRRQQSLPPGRGEGEPRSGRHRRDLGKARRRSQAPGWNRPTFQRTCRAAHRSWRRKTNESRPQVERPKGEESLPLAPSTRLRNERPLSTTNGNGGAASVNGRAKRPPGRRSVNAGSRRSTRRRLRWTRPSRSTRSGPPPSRPRSRLLRRDRKPKTPAGIRRRSDWKPRCGARGVSFLWRHPRVKASDHLQPFIFRDLVRVLRLGSRRRGPVDPHERVP